MSIEPYLESIVSGAAAPPPLSRAQAAAQLGELLDGRLDPLRTGALLTAWRLAAETPEALAGFVDAAEPRCLGVHATRPVAVLPSLHGAGAVPMLTPLLALWLAREGVPVLVHGPRSAACGPTCGEVLHDLGVSPADTADDVAARWARREPAFVSTETLCPPLVHLLEPCLALGWRSPAHHVARLLAPVRGAPALRVLAHGRAGTGRLLAGWTALVGAHTMLLPGTDGEPVAHPRRQPRIDVWLAGRARPELGAAAAAGSPAAWPVLPRGTDAAATAVWVQEVLSGERPVPAPLLCQIQLVLAALSALAALSTVSAPPGPAPGAPAASVTAAHSCL